MSEMMVSKLAPTTDELDARRVRNVTVSLVFDVIEALPGALTVEIDR